ncbi:hypothetical protein E2C01_035571 [Portunus trituberculatus]|uniref:Uncharacterized protein n=1 Tax=Portunus trituberculatus TaxID=210409 RepID=A0A5B7F3I0_PORTR|nr:hypothetical protein [Portunus trituberculatus]
MVGYIRRQKGGEGRRRMTRRRKGRLLGRGEATGGRDGAARTVGGLQGEEARTVGRRQGEKGKNGGRVAGRD